MCSGSRLCLGFRVFHFLGFGWVSGSVCLLFRVWGLGWLGFLGLYVWV